MTEASGDILRGMEVERAPLRVGRPRAALPGRHAGAPSTAPAPQPDPTLLEELRRAARGAGYEEGRREGLEDAAREAAAAVDRAVAEALAPLQKRKEELAALCASLAATRGDWLQAAEDDMVALCFDTVCHIVGGSVLQPESVRGLLRAQAARLAEGAHVSIHVHPQDAELLQGDGTDGQVRYVADPQVALGGCIVRQPGGALDARLETMLAACKDALLAARAKASPGARP